MLHLISRIDLTDKGKILLETVLEDKRKTSQGFQLTQERVGMILSIQDRIFPTEDGRWKIEHKRAQGGHLNIKRLKNKFYGSTK